MMRLRAIGALALAALHQRARLVRRGAPADGSLFHIAIVHAPGLAGKAVAHVVGMGHDAAGDLHPGGRERLLGGRCVDHLRAGFCL